ncbi:MAG TPA: AMP-binding protein, partial [Polyangiaceae bacterium]|nr:AMP-binding protein [Polyangiaceae bacterium]
MHRLLSYGVISMNDHAHQLPSSEQELLDEVCEGRPRRVSPAPPIELVERFARDKPDATAVHYGGERLTYSELNRRANRLAHWLIARRMGRERRIVVRVEPSFDVVVVLLAILKTGAAYVPVDPAYPAAHLRAILDDTGAELMLETTRREAREATGTESFGLDELEDALGGFSGENLSHPVDTAATAYVFYTSGTTGAPKGVMASYANLASYIAAARERYDFTSADVMPAIARFGFSISLFELLTPLSAGGTLRILDRADVLDPAKLADILRTVTVFHAGPSLLRPVLDHIRARFDDVSAFDGVRHASSGGDLIAPELLEWAKDVFRNAQVFVIYGCSE